MGVQDEVGVPVKVQQRLRSAFGQDVAFLHGLDPLRHVARVSGVNDCLPLMAELEGHARDGMQGVEESEIRVVELHSLVDFHRHEVEELVQERNVYVANRAGTFQKILSEGRITVMTTPTV